MFQPRSIQSSMTLRDKIMSMDYVLLLSILLLGIINVALPVLNIPGEFQKAIYGLIIVVALALDQLIIYRMKKLSVSSNV